MTTLTLDTRQRTELIDITAKLRAAVHGSGIREGIAVVYTPHTTAALTINENADPDVVADLLATFDQLAPRHARYRHAEGNSDAHVKSSLIGPSVTLIVANGAPLLGTWQGIWFAEFDGPRCRQVHVKVLGA